MAGNNVYQILLQALLEEKSIGTEIERINKLIAGGGLGKIKLSSMIENPVGTGGSAGGFGGAAGDLVDQIRASQAELSAILAEMGSDTGRTVGEIKKKFSEAAIGEREMVGATVTLTNEVGNLETRIYSINQATGQLSMNLKETTASMKNSAVAAQNLAGKISNSQAELRAQIELLRSGAGGVALKKVDEQYTKNAQGIDELSGATLRYSDSNGKAQIATYKIDQSTGKLGKSLKSTAQDMGNVEEKTASWTKQIGNNIIKSAQWAIAMTVVYGSLKAIRDGIEYIVELNKELTDTRIVVGMTAEEAKGLATNYNQLASEMGATTLEVAKGSLEWFRQGKTVEEAMDLTSQSIMMAKLANMDTAQSTEYLTSIINGFKLEAEDVTLVIDKLVNLDNQFATSVSEIANAMQRSSNSASQAGITLDELASYITVLSSVTRKSSESIGESFKTMFARMQNIKLGKMFEDDATTLNDVEKALSLVNVELRDSATSFRPLGDVIDEIASKWDGLNDIEQSAVANAIAGVRQRENFLVLMSNYNQVLRAQTIETESAGLATKRYDIYMQGLEARANKSKAAWEGVWQATINSEAIGFFIDLSTKIGNVTKDAGGLIPVLATVIGLLIAMQATNAISFLNTLRSSIVSVITSFKGMLTGASLASGGWIGIIIVAVASLVQILNYASKASERYAESFKEAMDAMKETTDEIKKLKQEQEDVAELWKEYEQLGKKIKKTTEEAERYNEIQNRLHELFPELAGSYDDDYNFLLDSKVTLGQILVLEKERLEVARELASVQAKEVLKTGVTVVKDNEKKIKQYEDELAGINNRIKIAEETLTPDQLENDEEFSGMYKDLIRRARELNGLIDELEKSSIKTEHLFKNMFRGMGVEARDALIAELDPDGTSQILKDWIRQIEEQIIADAYAIGTGNDEILPEIDVSAFSADMEALSGIVDGLASRTSSLVSAMKEFAENGSLSNETVLKLIDSNAEFAQYLSLTADGWKLNTVAALADVQAQLKLAEADLLVAETAYKAALAMDTLSAADRQSAREALIVASAQLIKVRALEQQILNWDKITSSVGAATSAVNKYNEALKETYNLQIKGYEAEKKRLLKLLENYKKIIDAKKESLRLEKEEADYTRELGKKQKKAADLMAEIEALKLDNSAEANARRLELEAELAEAQLDIQETQAERSYELQIEALDREYELFKEFIDKQIEALDLLIDKIKELIAAIGSGTGGSGGDPNTDPDPDTNKEKDYDPREHVDKGGTTGSEKKDKDPIPFHEGGIVGDLAANEEFAKLMKGEVVVNQDQMDRFMNSTLPEFSSQGGGDITIEMPINVAGNLDKDVLPDLETMVNKAFEKMNTTLLNRGYKRGVDQIY